MEIEILCNDCNEPLIFNTRCGNFDITFDVDPCKCCMAKEYDKGYEARKGEEKK